MSKKVEGKNNLGYLGINYQYRLVKCFIEDGQFFTRIQHIVDQNMFTEDALRRIVGFMKDRFAQAEVVATYSDIDLLVRSKISDPTTVEVLIATLEEIKGLDMSGMDIVESESEKFFKQQNLTKAINKSIEIIKSGNSSDYYAIEDIMKSALDTNTKEEHGFGIFDSIESDLRDDYRQVIPTGVPEVDKSLGGGLGRGELGLVVAPMGVGKAQPLNARILTPEGFKTMGDMFVGCRVMGADGGVYRVCGVYPQGIRPVYRVAFSNGTSCECDINHLWKVDRGLTSFFNENSSEILSLKEILSICKADKETKFKLPSYSVMEFDSQTVEKDPYLFGMDCFKKTDRVNYDEVKKYVYNSKEIRKEFVHGLIHSGVVRCNVKEDCVLDYEISFVDDSMAELLNILLKSLGYSTKIVKIGNDISKVVWKNLKTRDTIYITDIKYLREDYTQCIMIDSDEHLYITEDFIVTHNTSIMTGFAAAAALAQTEGNNYNGYKVLHFFFEDKEESIRRKYFGYLLDMDACTLSEASVRPIAIERLKSDDLEGKILIKNNIIAERLNSGEVSASQIKQKIKSHIARGFKPDLVIVDYFECLKPEKTSGLSDSEWTKEGITMRRLESICNEMNIALWVPVQSTKTAIGLDFVGLQHAGGSVAKTQIGHVVITLARTETQKSEGRLNLYIQKLRAVRIGRDQFLNVKFNNGTCKFDMSNLDSVEDVAAIDQAHSRQVANDVKRDARYNNNR